MVASDGEAPVEAGPTAVSAPVVWLMLKASSWLLPAAVTKANFPDGSTTTAKGCDPAAVAAPTLVRVPLVSMVKPDTVPEPRLAT